MRHAAETVERLFAMGPTLTAQSGPGWLTSTGAAFLAAIVFAVVGVYLMLRRGPRSRWVGAAMGLVAVLVLARRLEPLGQWGWNVAFWCLAGLTVVAAVATIASRNPIYCAIWFAVSLLGTGALFLLQGAEFLGLATVVVYAGAIVVTFLFLLMLAQPGGHAYYDRISWGTPAMLLATLAGVTITAGIALAVSTMSGDSQVAAGPVGQVQAQGSEELLPVGLAGGQHVARLGGQLFARHLIAIEVVGTLLLVALVGAIAIVMQGKPVSGPRGGESRE